MKFNNSVIRIYDREWMLIELMRFKAKIPMVTIDGSRPIRHNKAEG